MNKIIFWGLMTLLLIPSCNRSEDPDWINLGRYETENEQLGQPTKDEKRIVLMGNSITENWKELDPGFFKEHHLINRGIGGQTTAQMLVRMRPDVIDLKPDAVFILAGINDIGVDSSPSGLKSIRDNIQGMATLAQAAGVKVFLCSIVPSNRIPWRNNRDPSPQIRQINEWIKEFATANNYGYVDYYTPLADSAHGLPEKYTTDGIHLTLAGYKVMEETIMPFVNKVRE